MKVYTRRASSPFKWILAGLVFVIAMTFTMAEVNGFNYPPSSNGDNQTGYTQPKNDEKGHRSDGDKQKTFPPDNNTPPCAVPEPTTFLLMAAGLGLAYWSMNRKTVKA